MNKLNITIDKIADNKKYHFWIFFIVLLFLTAAMMNFYKPLCPGQDFFFHFRRLQALMDGLKNSSFLFYIDYSAIDGYGYFTKAFYSDFILIPFAVIGNLTSLEFAYQFMLFTMTVLCGVFTYISVNAIFRKPYAAAIAALLYTFAIYRLLDIYHRAAIGEALSFTFVPIVFLGLYHIIHGNYRTWYIIAIGFSLMIFTHLISSVLMFITVLIFLIIYNKSLRKEPKRLIYLCVAGATTLIITSYFIFPFLEQLASNTFYYEAKNIMSKTEDAAMGIHWIIWGMFTGIINPKQIFVPGVGLLLTCAVCLRLFVYNKSIELKRIDIGVFVGLGFIFACSSLFPWSFFPFNTLNFIQMPWRFFEFSSYLFAIAGGFYLSQILRTNTRMLLAGGIVVTCIAFVMANDGKSYQTYRCGRPITQEATVHTDYHMGGLEYIPAKVPSIDYIAERGNTVITENSNTTISDIKKNNGVTTFSLSTDGNEIVETPLLYYKGYKAEINGKDISVTESDNGLVQLSTNESGNVKIYYGGTIIQKISFFVTIISILLFCIYIFLNRKKNTPIGIK